MTWQQIKRTFPVGNIQYWTVKRVVPFGAIMAVTDLKVEAILEFMEFSDNATFPIKFPERGDTIRCVVLYHSPVDKKVRISAKARNIWRVKNLCNS